MSLLQGIGVLLVTLAIYGYNMQTGRGELEARTLTFVTLVLANLGLILSNRFRSNTLKTTFRSKNMAVRWIIAATLVFLVLVVYIPALRSLFHFDVLHPLDWAFCVGAGVVCILWFEITKLLNHKRETGKS
jgi:Ca2+-transporting ATPase